MNLHGTVMQRDFHYRVILDIHIYIYIYRGFYLDYRVCIGVILRLWKNGNYYLGVRVSGFETASAKRRVAILNFHLGLGEGLRTFYLPPGWYKA